MERLRPLTPQTALNAVRDTIRNISLPAADHEYLQECFVHMAERMTKAIQLEALEAQREAAAKTAAEKEGSAANASGSKSEPEPPRPFEAPSSKAPS